MNRISQESRRFSTDRDWKQQLSRLAEELPPDEGATDVVMLLHEAEVVDQLVWEKHPDLKDTLVDYGISDDTIDIHEVGPDLFEVKVTDHFSERRLPDGYGYKGGAARALLLRTLGMDPTYLPRDIDVMSFHDTDPEQDRAVAEEFMAEDLEMSSKERIIERYDDDYMDTRDITINQLYATDETITVTKQCLLDTVRHIIRPTEYELEKFSESLGPKMLSKILRF